MFLDGTGGPFSSDPVFRRSGWGVAVLDFTDVFAPSLVFCRGGGLSAAKQTVAKSEVYAGIQALGYAPRKTPKVLISDNEHLVSTAQRRRANNVGPCRHLWHQYWAVEYHASAILVMKVKSRAREWSLWSGHQLLWMFAGGEFADRLPSKGAEAHPHSEWTLKIIAGVRSLARTVQRRVATVMLHMADQYLNESIHVSHVAVHHCKNTSNCPRTRSSQDAGSAP